MSRRLLLVLALLAPMADATAGTPAAAACAAARLAADDSCPATPGSDAPAAAATSGPAGATGPAAEAVAPPPYAARLREEAKHVLASPDFHEHRSVRYPAMRDWLRKLLERKPAKATPSTPPNFAVLATIFQYAALALLAAALAWLLWRGWQWLAPGRQGPRAARSGRPLAEVRVLALPDTPLPEQVLPEARAAWQAGDATLALSLLFRGAVRELQRRHGIELPDSATEGECLRHARRSGAAVVTTAFAPIVQAWMALAYARRVPADVEALFALYGRHFEAAPETTP